MASKPAFNPYTEMEFPAYTFKEFPKEVRRPDGTAKIVHNQKEELDFMTLLTDSDDNTFESPLAKERDDLAEKLTVEQQATAALQARIAELEAKLTAQASTTVPPVKK